MSKNTNGNLTAAVSGVRRAHLVRQPRREVMRRFDGRAALVTGGGHGIGRASAHRLASEGASVTVADLDLAAAQAVADELGKAGTAAVAVRCDVRDRSSVEAATARAVDEFDRLDVLVNTAGGGGRHPDFPDTDDSVWEALLDLNLVGVVRCIRAALPHLLAAPEGGSVVTISSVNGMATFGSEPYSAAKSGLQILTANLAAKYGPQGVRFNLVAPGTIRTRVWDDQADSLARLARLYPLGRVGEPDDVAAAVAFLASGDAAWITGTVLPVDGGILSAGPTRSRS
ncbi:glucose 1-dehydrogenase [Actinopolymorpha rutila]|uniref:SDR family NAD(P)-dependent oxidoreductase n=2 Tax=Actinopolymorpha rutila TaxID=446787 RepID=UPI00307F9330